MFGNAKKDAPAAPAEAPAPAAAPETPPVSQEALSAYGSTFATGEHNKVHHAYIWLAPFSATFAVVVVVLLNSMQGLIEGYQALAAAGMGSLPVIVAALLGGLLLIYGLVTLVSWLAYRNLRYVFDEREFSLYSGIITKRRVHVPYARVQSVNHKAGILQRVFGLCSVSIDTAGGASNKAVRVPYVSLADGERIRRELFLRKAVGSVGLTAAGQADACAESGGTGDPCAGRGAGLSPLGPAAGLQHAPDSTPLTFRPTYGAEVQPAAPNALDSAVGDLAEVRGLFGGAQIPGMEPVTYEVGLSNAELALASATHAAPLAVGFSFGATGVAMGLALGVELLPSPLFLPLLGVALAAGVLSTLLGALVGFIPVVLSYGGFKTVRRGSRIEMEHGLLQREFSGLDVDRIQSVNMRQGVLRRLLGYCEVTLGRIDTAGDENSGGSTGRMNARGLVVHPFVKVERVDELLGNLLPEWADMPRASALTPLPAVAQRRAYLRRLVWRNPWFWTALCAAVLHAIVAWAASSAGTGAGIPAEAASALYALCALCYLLAAVATALKAVSARRWYTGSGHALTHRFVALYNDGLATDYTVIPRQKVQSGRVRTNPFQRAAGVGTIAAVTAGGATRTTAALWDVSEEDAQKWLDWLKPHAM